MRFLYLIISVAVLCSSVNLAAQTEETHDYLQYLPQETVAVFALHNAKTLQGKFQVHPIAKFMKDEAVQKFLEMPLQKFEQEILAPHGLDFNTCLQYLNIAQGQIIFALLDITGKGDKVEDYPLVLMVDSGDQVGTLVELLERLRAQAEEINLVVVEEDFMGTPIVYFKEGEGETEFKEHQEIISHFCYCLKDSLLIVGLKDRGVKEILSRMNMETRPNGLLEAEVYINAFSPCRVSDSDYTIFIHGTRILEFVLAQIAPEELEEVKKLLSIMGLDSLQALAASGNFYDNGRFVGKAFLLGPGPRQGFLKLLQAETQSSLLPMAVPEDVAAYTAISFSPEVVWEIIMEILELASEQERKNAMAQLEIIEIHLQFSFSQDFFPSLGNEVRIYKDYTQPMGLHSERTTVTFSLKDSDKFQMCMEKFIFLMEQKMLPFQKETFMGTTIYVLDENLLDPPAFCIFNKQFIFSTKRSGVEKAIRLNIEGTGNLLSSEGFKQMLPMAQGFKNLLYYRDMAAEIEFLRAASQEIFLEDAQFRKETGEWVNWDLLPSAEVIAKYFCFLEIGSITVHPQGFLLETFVKSRN